MLVRCIRAVNTISKKERKPGFDEKLDLIDKVSIPVCYPAKGLRLNHVVNLSTKKDKNRDYYYKEWIYHSKNVANYNELISVKMNLSYFLILESIKNENRGTKDVNIMFRCADIMRLINVMNTLNNLFNIRDLYYTDREKNLYLGASYKDMKETLRVGNNTLVFKPAVLDRNDIPMEGLRIQINREELEYEMTLDNMLELTYILKTTDFYTASLAAVSHLGRPKCNNYISMVESSYKDANHTGTSGNISGTRQIGGGGMNVDVDDPLSAFQQEIKPKDRTLQVKF